MEKVDIQDFPDKCVWMRNAYGNFSTKSAFQVLRPYGINRPSLLKIWNHSFNPRASLFGWRILQRVVPTDDRIADCGIYLASSCSCCADPSIEDMDHLFHKGELPVVLWKWACPLFHSLNIGPHITSTLWNIISVVTCRSTLGFIATYVMLLMLWEIWKFRCAKRFDSTCKSVGKIIIDISYAVNVAIQGVTFKQERSPSSLAILQVFGFKPMVKLKAPKIVRWIPPQHGVCHNVDGACKGNHGPCGGGGCLRTQSGDAILSFTFYYGHGDSLLAEVRALCDGLRLAVLHGHNITSVYSDSLVLVQSLNNDKCPSWKCPWWCRLAQSMLHDMHICVVHSYREANRVADAFASYACDSHQSSIFTSSNIPTGYAPLVHGYAPLVHA
ncbi:hypothetical protein Taro_043794 [Colocasia esculenta]|uniref:RNase H type-1 domain-containing protein n=1 Tax=Colocasia esculenta TaxID=4460 RepID=A0A843X1D7_COLES|nr:hypothetical protein [Colocasia esculenta]